MFWYNLFTSGEGDYSTRHAACPVLVGNKWGELPLRVRPGVALTLGLLCLRRLLFLLSPVSNKWIHERGQEWRRPCGLTESE